MKTAGDYALLYANGMSFKDIVEMIRAEADEDASDPEQEDDA